MAERIWSAFWRHSGKPLDKLRHGVRDNFHDGPGVPFCLVAERAGRVCGTASVIANDEPSRPELTPWLAALWVDEDVRKQGIAAALLGEGVRRCGRIGVRSLYLTSRPALRDFYTRLGWLVQEDEVGEHRLVLYARELGALPSRP